MIEVSTKHQLLHEVPCFFWWSLEWLKGKPSYCQTGPLTEIPSDRRFAKMASPGDPKKMSPWNLPFHLGGTLWKIHYKMVIFNSYVKLPEGIHHVQTHPGHNLRWIRWIRWYSMPSHCEIILTGLQGINRSKITVFSSNQQWYPQ